MTPNDAARGQAGTLRSWRERANTVGVIPGKSTDQLFHFQQIARALPLPDTAGITLTSSTGKQSEVRVDDVCGKQLSRSGLIQRNESSEWEPTPEVLRALANSDDLEIARILHSNIKFFGEMLREIGSDTRIGDLLHSVRKYGLTWTSKDQLSRRITWAKCLGLVEQWTFGGSLVVTTAGANFLRSIEVCSPEIAISLVTDETQEPDELPAASKSVQARLSALDETSLRARKSIIGYIPRGMNAGKTGASSGSTTASPIQALRTILRLLGERSSIEGFADSCMKEFGLKKASFDQMLHTVRNLDLIEPVAFNEYSPTEVANDILAPGAELDFVRHLHCKFAFVGELLAAVTEPTATSALVKISREKYMFTKIDNQELRLRLGFLADADLVDRIDWTRYRVSARGQELIRELPAQQPSAATTETAPSESLTESISEPPAGAPSLMERLRNLSTDPTQSRPFEIAVAEAFSWLGFEAIHLGGNGGTDVILRTHIGPGESYKVIVDAKTASAGVLTETQVMFPALKKHKEANSADLGAIVAPDFPKRTREWAPENGFSLITIDELIHILELHSELPLTTGELRYLFEADSESLSRVLEVYESERRNRLILSRVVKMLFEEASDDDPIRGGIITRGNLSYSLRRELKPRPDQNLVDSAINLLESPLVRAILMEPEKDDGMPRDGDTLHLTDSPQNVRLRLRRLGVEIEPR